MGVACSQLSGSKEKQNEKKRQKKENRQEITWAILEQGAFQIEKQECPGLKSILYPEPTDHSPFGQECGPARFSLRILVAGERCNVVHRRIFLKTLHS